jgi:hypothetical protein
MGRSVFSGRQGAGVSSGAGTGAPAVAQTGRMRTIGLLGGMSWESTVVYYQRLNRGVRERLGGLHSA